MTAQRFTNVITKESELRGIFGEVSERAAKKQIERLDVHCRAIIEKCPFILLGTSDAEGRCDVSQKEITLVLFVCWMIGRSPFLICRVIIGWIRLEIC